MKGSPIRGVHHVALAVCDLPAAQRFYRQAASLQDWGAAEALGLGPLLCSANGGLRLHRAASGQVPLRRPVSEAGVAHLCLQTPGLAAVIERFATAGACFHSNPVDLGTGFLYSYARDPEHNVTEIECTPPVWADDRPWLAHVNIVTADLPRLLVFYEALLGQSATRSPRLGGDTRFDQIADLPQVQLRAAWLNAGNMQIELMQYLHPATLAATGRRASGAPGYSGITFEVDDLNEASAHLRACGGSAEEVDPGAALVAATDPDGNRLWLLDPRAAGAPQAAIAHLAAPRITQSFAAARAALSV